MLQETHNSTSKLNDDIDTGNCPVTIFSTPGMLNEV